MTRRGRWHAPRAEIVSSSSSSPPSSPQPTPSSPPHLEPTRASSVLGYPRIGPRRELKRALERYWHGDGTRAELLATGRRLRDATWHDLRARGVTQIPGNTFSFYDHILDDALLMGAVPARFRELVDGLTPVDTVFALARGRADVPPLELVSLQGTTYLYRQPEFDEASELGLRPDELLAEVTRAREQGVEIRPVITGPLSLLLLSKAAPSAAPSAAPGFEPIDLLDRLLAEYEALLDVLAGAGVTCVQFNEPCMTMERTADEITALRRAYDRLSAVATRPRILVTGEYGDLGEALPALAATGIEAIGLDLVYGRRSAAELADVPGLRGKRLYAGVVDGQNVWRTDKFATLDYLRELKAVFPDVVVSTSCTLLHVPYDVVAETGLPAELADSLAFAEQKVAEVVSLAHALVDGPTPRWRRLPVLPSARREDVRARTARVDDDDRVRVPYPERAARQADRLGLPTLPTATLGSFPQTVQIRRARRDLADGRIDYDRYCDYLRAEIASVIRLQEDIGLDVLVHGEVERNDMVQYFAELLDGFAATRSGWVQSYGSRCVRPPILYGDVARPAPMTVEWTGYAQSLTDRPVKGMVTGPVTMLARSFCRTDLALPEVATQLALVVRDEVADLEAAGTAIIQIDEPAIRELLPRRGADRRAYLDWAVGTFRLASAGARPDTQIHTHLNYSSLQVMKEAIEELDADVTAIVATRSIEWVLDALTDHTLTRQVAPGVYESRSGFVPDIDLLHERLLRGVDAVGVDRLWAVPDGGLKSRYTWQLEPSLRNLVAAARRIRRAVAPDPRGSNKIGHEQVPGHGPGIGS
ncbi:5-methyltetrahydropteroyltriglutamate--homocysteine S-methyltransferase [Dietzia sp. B32]|uniref:5-methyltetrahydropteroyltriglutamate-- homocysteine S-methyltransferase n=1 Tax=Dietzia sp. B32 TaxID=2915130 RepID=UPI0021AD88D7|nr:5-methyltetrahydropteroyltriglutamate--homocysteine S-methyltransferase [Dietzia sp. B32]UVE96563.1 5-methyltetrahydropteroyltriglutamate--homocysteine S-methyltransferase [Dietzia sp. B32]